MSKLEEMSQTPVAQMVAFADGELKEPHGGALLAQRFDLIGNLKVKVEAYLGDAELSVEELFALRENSVVPLKAAPADPVDLLIDGKLIGRGTLVVVGDSFGVRITEVAK